MEKEERSSLLDNQGRPNESQPMVSLEMSDKDIEEEHSDHPNPLVVVPLLVRRALLCGSFLVLLVVLTVAIWKNGHASVVPCDCYHHTINGPCCERLLFRTHKFGTILLGDLFADFRVPRATFQIQTRPTPKTSSNNESLLSTMDYRHVLVTRNWLDAIVSGYLYHRAGYECTLEYGGTAGHHSKRYFDLEIHYHNKYWDTQHMQYHELFHIPYPPRNNRSLCQYLADESEEEGIKVIIDVALSRWYKGVVSYHETAIQNHPNKSLFLCYEDLVDPFQQEDLFYRILAFFFPGIADDVTRALFHMPPQLKAALVLQQVNHTRYDGTHASARDPALRRRLRTLVQRYDHELFHDRIAVSNAVFGCGAP